MPAGPKPPKLPRDMVDGPEAGVAGVPGSGYPVNQPGQPTLIKAASSGSGACG